jgi:uncharacterized protein YwqG
VVSTGGHDRRSFFRELLRGASRAAHEVETLRRVADDAARQSAGLDEDPDTALRPIPAVPTTRVATLDDLRGLCADVGRETWADHAVSLARTSVRLTPGGDGSSWLGGSPRVPGLEWPTWNGGELAFVARIGLAGLSATRLPAHGALLVFFALDRVPAGMRPDDAGGCRVIHADDDEASDELREGALPRVDVTPSGELTLPAVPSTIDLDIWDLEEWAELRERLATHHGVELEERAADYHAIHRLLGHPDTFAADMEVDAHLVSQGVDLEEEPYANVLDEDLVREAAGWTLLFQLSNDDGVGVEVGDFQRLYVWIHEDHLTAGRFDRVRAFVR